MDRSRAAAIGPVVVAVVFGAAMLMRIVARLVFAPSYLLKAVGVLAFALVVGWLVNRVLAGDRINPRSIDPADLEAR